GVLARSTWKRATWKTVLVVVPVLVMAALRIGPLVVERIPPAKRLADSIPLNASAKWVTTQSSVNFTAGTSSSGSGDVFASDDAVLFPRAEDSLTRVVVDCVARGLRESGRCDNVRVAETNPIAGKAGRLPDLYFGLAVTEHESRIFPGYRRDRVRLRIMGGTSPFKKSHHTVDGMGPPIMDGNLDASIEYQGTMNGWTIGRTKTDFLAADIAAKALDAISDSIENWAEKGNTFTTFPESLYGAYRPVDVEIPFPANPGRLEEAASVEVVVRAAGLMMHNRSIWRIAPVEKPDPLLREMRAALEHQGWHDNSHPSGTGKGFTRIRLTRGEDVVEAFHTSGQGLRTTGPDFDAAVIVDYQDRFDAAEIRAALEPLLARNTSLDLLTILQRQFTRAGLRDEWGEAVVNRTPDSVHAAMALSKWYESEGRTEEARFAMQQALVLNDVAGHEQRRSFDKDETFGLSKDEDLYFTPQVLDSLGAVSLEGAEFPIELDVQLGSPLILYYGVAERTCPGAWAFTFTQGEKDGFVAMSEVQVHPGLSTCRMGGTSLPLIRHIQTVGNEDLPRLQGTLERREDGALRFTVR
ncbi:MAG: hypothetical protein R6V12_01530, partial [Candidatus Hydrogenedentota bacterium]